MASGEALYFDGLPIRIGRVQDWDFVLNVGNAGCEGRPMCCEPSRSNAQPSGRLWRGSYGLI